MSIAIYTRNVKQSQSWADILKSNLQNERIEIYPNISDFVNVTFLVCWKPEEGLLGKFPNLKAIQSLGAGVDHILDNHVVPSHIKVSKVVDVNLTHDMWEHSMSIILSDMKNLPLHAKNQKSKIWKPKRYTRIKDVSIGILGLGSIGKYVASQFALMGFKVGGWSRSKKEIQNVDTYSEESGLKTLLSVSDYVINILPLTKETRSIVDLDFLAKMKQGSYFINIGRGPHVVNADLLSSIDTGKLRGAALDVFEKEPLPIESAIWNHPLITITPHIASLTHIDSVFPQVIENYNRLINGELLLNLVDLSKGY
ncbi:MAG: glyoxylate/hydroxypyruvate reductase A [Saprospiraceae bacterium]|jgi:glyoxylate/hydroxypyruvate reductase A|tara:strand:+ start:119 stop:1051 length:933 start_codon:yes stop_codon:yes gene_type:complete